MRVADSEWRRRQGPLKRALDVAAAIVLLLVLAPVIAGVALAIALSMGQPVVFRQTRIGWREAPFTLYKFRTMNDQRHQTGDLLPDDQRLTRLGRWLRSWSLDELPQLWNVLKGEMSFIGPRPLLPEYLPRYTPAQRRRHDVLPGLSGLAQVCGRNAITWERRLALDVEYVEKRSLGFDLWIALLTVKKMVLREGISQQGHATMEEFRGVESNG
ncbi:MAG: sugar transferase [Bryobacterales bacterium]|nr:sugar transferase [Bryobacterales bacterium]